METPVYLPVLLEHKNWKNQQPIAFMNNAQDHIKFCSELIQICF